MGSFAGVAVPLGEQCHLNLLKLQVKCLPGEELSSIKYAPLSTAYGKPSGVQTNSECFLRVKCPKTGEKRADKLWEICCRTYPRK